MSFLNLGGLTKGLTAGINYDIQFKRNLVWALSHGNTKALAALQHIAETNIKELAGTGTHITDQILIALVTGGSDPTAGSREAMHQFTRDFGDH